MKQLNQARLLRHAARPKGYFLLAGVLLLLLFSGGAHAQTTAPDPTSTITLPRKTMAIRLIFAEITRQTKFEFFYSNDALNVNKEVTLSSSSMRLPELLNQILGSDYTHNIQGNRIIIVPSQRNPGTSQETLISGTVTHKGTPLPGASVTIAGTSLATVTDAKGSFRLISRDGATNVTVIVRYVGMKTNTEKFSGKPLQIDLEEEAAVIENVVITGYEVKPTYANTGAITTKKMDELLVPGISTIDKLIEGNVPGVMVTGLSGQVGAAPKLRIRGTSTILGNREPVWVLDGIVLADPVNVDPSRLNDPDFVNLLGNAISGINPEDIDQIDVLKDAAATALYGVKAANGVIVITTKKGKTGPPSVNYSGTFSLSFRPRYSDPSVNLMNSRERMDVAKEMVDRGLPYSNVTLWTGYEAVVQDYYAGRIGYDEYLRQVKFYENVNTDWFDILCRDAVSSTHTVSLAGGSQNIKYYASAGLNNEQGVIRGEYNKRYTTALNVTANYEKLTASFSVQGNIQDRKYNDPSLGVLNYAYKMSRTVPAFNEDGSLWYYPKETPKWENVYDYNILDEMQKGSDQTNGSTFNMRASLGYKLFKDLKLDGLMGYQVSNTTQNTIHEAGSYYITSLREDQSLESDLCPRGGELVYRSNNTSNWMARLQAIYIKNIADKHTITATIGVEPSSTSYNVFSITRRGYNAERKLVENIPTEYTGFYQFFLTSSEARGTISETMTNRLAWYGIAGYEFGRHYMLNLHVRQETSNLFGARAKGKIMPIWALSGRWNIHENLLRDTHWIDDLNVRTSFGYQGNMLDFQSPKMVIRQGELDPIYNEYRSTIVSLPDPDRKFEKTMSFNGGIGFSIFKGAVTGSIDAFLRRTEDAFLDKTVSEINGRKSETVTEGLITNHGFEIALGFKAIDRLGAGGGKNKFIWRIDPMIGEVLNQLLNNPLRNNSNTLRDVLTVDDLLTGQIPIPGQPLGTFYSFKFKGLSHEDGSPIFYGLEKELQGQYIPLYDQLIEDANGDMMDMYMAVLEASGRRDPILQGGLRNTIIYGNFTLSFNFSYSLGNKIRLMKICSGYATNMPYPQDNMRREFVERWRRPGDEKYTSIPSLMTLTASNGWWVSKGYFPDAFTIYHMYDDSDLRVVSGNYVKLQSVSLRYILHERACKTLGINNASVSLSGTNLFTLASSKLKGQDPSQTGSSMNIGLSSRPSFSCNVNINF